MDKLLYTSLTALLLFVSTQSSAETNFIKYKNYLIPIVSESADECTTTNPNGYHKVIVATDLNHVAVSDPDDIQSMVHLIVTSRQFEMRGIISSPFPVVGPYAGDATDRIRAIIDAYAADFARVPMPSYNTLASAQKGLFPTPNLLRSMVVRGLESTGNNPIPNVYQPGNPSHAGAGKIIQEATAMLNDIASGGEPCQRLYVLAWGGIGDLALALKHSESNDLGLERVLRSYFIASSNRNGSQYAYDYIRNTFLEANRLWFIQSEGAFRGMSDNLKTAQDRDLLNIVKNRGCLGYALDEAAKVITSRETILSVKAGDTPSLLYILNGNQDDPTGESWGGQFKAAKNIEGNLWWVDKTVSLNEIPTVATNTPANGVANATFAFLPQNTITVRKHIGAIYADWIGGMNFLPIGSTSSCRANLQQRVF